MQPWLIYVHINGTNWQYTRYNILTLVISNLNCLVATRINQSEQTLIIFALICWDLRDSIIYICSLK